MAPKPDKRTKEDVLRHIERLAASYTPEWRFHRCNPDFGSTLALLYADLMENIISYYNDVPTQNRSEFLKSLGAETQNPRKAEGYMTFGLVKPDMPETCVPKGYGVAVKSEEEGIVRFETLDQVYVSSSDVCLWEQESRWYLRFDRAPTCGLISLLFVTSQWESHKDRVMNWEYFGLGGWTLLKVEDETGELSHTGIVRFAGTPDFRETQIHGQTGYWIRIAGAKGEDMPISSPRVFINGARVRAQKPGKESNLPPGEKHRLIQSVGYVSRIANPDRICGGSDEEPKDRAVLRNCARIRHQFRAVTPGDFERLVYEACPDIRMARCFPGYEEKGTKKSGAVTVVILQEDYLTGRHYFYQIQEQVLSYLEGKAEGLLLQNGNLFVTAPQWIRMKIQTEIYVADHQQVLQVEREADGAIARFLDPVSGGYEGMGWQLGRLPEYTQMKRCLQSLSGVYAVRQLWISYELEVDGGFRETEEALIRRMPWTLPTSGDHRIVVTVIGHA